MKLSSHLCHSILVILFLCRSAFILNGQVATSLSDLNYDDLSADSIYVSVEPFEEQIASTLKYMGINPINKFIVQSKYRLVQNAFITILKVREQTDAGVTFLPIPELISSKFIMYDQTAASGLPPDASPMKEVPNYFPIYLPLLVDKRMSTIKNNDSLYLSFGERIINPLDLEASLIGFSTRTESILYTAPINSIVHLFSAQIKIPSLEYRGSKIRTSGDFVMVLSAAIFDPNKQEAFNTMYNSTGFLQAIQKFSRHKFDEKARVIRL